MQKRIAHEEALFFEDLLKKEINEDREAHGRRPLKEKDDDDNTPSGGTGSKEEKTIKSPMTKKGFVKKHEYAYDEYYDCYICPNTKVLTYSTTNRDGYREYKSCGKICAVCPYLEQCTKNKDHIKVVTRHIWEHYSVFCIKEKFHNI